MPQHLSQILCEIDNSTLALLPCYTISGVNELLCEQWVGGMSKTDLADFFPQTVPKKYPRAPGDIPPPHKSAHNDILCTDSKGNQAKQDKHGGGVPLAAVLLCVARCLFLAFCIDRTRRKNNRIQSKQKRKQEKQANKTKSKGKRQAYNIIQYTHTKAREKKSK